MKTFCFLCGLLLFGSAVAETDTPLKPVRVSDVSLKNVPLKEGERIAAIEIEVAGARFRNVRIPDDWGFDVGPPVSDVSVLKGTAQHGVAMLFTTDEFQRFATLAFYDYGQFNRQFTIKVKLMLYLYDKKKVETERMIDLPSECVVLEDHSNHSTELAPGAVHFKIR